MAFNFFSKRIRGSTFLIILSVIFFACSENKKSNTSNTYYVEIINFNDSLKRYIEENLFGKVSYFKKNKLEIISVNYVTDDFPDMHYFKSIKGIEKKINQNTQKIRIEFNGNYSIDSIRYSLKKYNYRNKQWIKTSDMSFINATITYSKAKEFAIMEFGKQIINNTVLYSYN